MFPVEELVKVVTCPVQTVKLLAVKSAIGAGNEYTERIKNKLKNNKSEGLSRRSDDR